MPLGLADAGTYFHSDYSYLQVPARATTLYSIEVPKRAGRNTLFANQYAAYDDLPGAMKRRIDPLVAVHHYGNRKVDENESRTAASTLTDEQKAKMPLITHPVVRTHPVTGRRALYAVSGSSYGLWDAGRRGGGASRRAGRARDAAEVPGELRVRRRRRRRLDTQGRRRTRPR